MTTSTNVACGSASFENQDDGVRETRRILYVSHVGMFGGAERTLLDILLTLDRRRFSPRVVLPGPGQLSDRVAAAGIGVDYCPSLRRLRRSWNPRSVLRRTAALVSGARSLRRLVREYRPDLVHANSASAAFYALCMPLQFDCPVIWSVRDLTKAGLVERWVGRRATRLIAPSEACRRFAARLTRPSKIALIPNGVEVHNSAPPDTALRRELTSDANPLAIIVGQLVPWKGYEVALDAAQIVNQHNPNVRFAWIGEDLFGDDPGVGQRLEQSIEDRKLKEVFYLLGRRDDVREIMAVADMLIHPAYPEPFGRVIVEAMASGLSVVAFDGNHGPAEILRDGVDGLLVSPRKPEALAKAIRRLVEDEELRRKLGRSGRQRAREVYNRVLMTRRTEALYDAVATAAGAPEH